MDCSSYGGAKNEIMNLEVLNHHIRLNSFCTCMCTACECNLCSGGFRFTRGTLNIPASLTTQTLREFMDSGSVPKLCVIYACHECVNVVLATYHVYACLVHLAVSFSDT